MKQPIKRLLCAQKCTRVEWDRVDHVGVGWGGSCRGGVGLGGSCRSGRGGVGHAGVGGMGHVGWHGSYRGYEGMSMSVSICDFLKPYQLLVFEFESFVK